MWMKADDGMIIDDMNNTTLKRFMGGKKDLLGQLLHMDEAESGVLALRMFLKQRVR